MKEQTHEGMFLSEQLRAMRHLPPHAILREPERPGERNLLRNLLHLSDDLDPLTWILDAHGDLVARIALQQALINILQAITHEPQSPQADVPLISESWPEIAVWVQALTRHVDGTRLLALLNTADVAKPDTVREAVDSLRRLLPSLPSPDPRPPQDLTTDDFAFVATVLRSREARDPLAWLRTEVGWVTAIRALRRVIVQSCPPRSPKIAETIGHSFRTLSLRTTCDSSDMRCLVDRVVLGNEGILVTATLRLTRTTVAALPVSGHGAGCWTWPGFDRFTDNNGHSYLLRQIETASLTRHRTGLASTATMSWYPAPGPTVTEVQCSCRPARLTGFAVIGNKRPEALPSIFH